MLVCRILRVCQMPFGLAITRGFCNTPCFACMLMSVRFYQYTRFCKVVALRMYASSCQVVYAHAVSYKYLVSRVLTFPAAFSCTRDSANLLHSACMTTPASIFMYTRFLTNSSFRVYANPCQPSPIHAILQSCCIPRVYTSKNKFFWSSPNSGVNSNPNIMIYD